MTQIITRQVQLIETATATLTSLETLRQTYSRHKKQKGKGAICQGKIDIFIMLSRSIGAKSQLVFTFDTNPVS